MIDKTLIRDQVRNFVSGQILTGKYEPGTRVGLSSISEDLNISSTPVREALTQLQEKGIIMVEPNRGFFIPPLSLENANNIYPIIRSLECLAIDSTSIFEELQIRKLEKINCRLKQVNNNPSEMVRLDRLWHRTLVSQCKNELLLEKIEEMKIRATLYELFYMKDSNKTLVSYIHHQDIVNSLKKNKNTEVKKLLKIHWNLSLEFISDWLKEKENK